MKDLEKFIQTHRDEFDQYQPSPKVWAGISAGLGASLMLFKLANFIGLGSKKLLLGIAVASATAGIGIWAYQSNKPQKTGTAAVTQPADMKEVSADTVARDSGPGPKKTSQTPFAIGQVTPGENSGHEESVIPSENAQPGDSFYTGVRALTLNSFGYTFKIKRSNSQMTQVRILKPAVVRDKKTNSQLVLKIEQIGSELVLDYEKQKQANYQTVSPGEIEILIPDGEISRITTASCNIDLDGYTTPAISILTASGNISLKDLRGNLDIQASSGDIMLFNSEGDMACRNVSGEIRLEGVRGKLDLRTSSGNIKGESVSLVGTCTIESVSGNVYLGFRNSADELSFDVSSVSGRLRIAKGNIASDGKQSLRAGSGKIPVVAKTISGNQEYR